MNLSPFHRSPIGSRIVGSGTEQLNRKSKSIRGSLNELQLCGLVIWWQTNHCLKTLKESQKLNIHRSRKWSEQRATWGVVCSDCFLQAENWSAEKSFFLLTLILGILPIKLKGLHVLLSCPIHYFLKSSKKKPVTLHRKYLIECVIRVLAIYWQD